MGDAGRSLQITGRLSGGMSWAPSCSEWGGAAASIVQAPSSVALTEVV